MIMIPSEEYELTANSLGTHMKVTESSSSMGHSEITVGLLRAFGEFATLTVNPLPPLHGESSDDLMNISQQAHLVSSL